MKHLRKLSLLVCGGLVLACGATCVNAQQDKIKTTTEIEKHQHPKTTTPAGPASRVVARVPDVVGWELGDAWEALARAGLPGRTTYLKDPDPSVRRGHVRATIPKVIMADRRKEGLVP